MNDHTMNRPELYCIVEQLVPGLRTVVKEYNEQAQANHKILLSDDDYDVAEWIERALTKPGMSYEEVKLLDVRVLKVACEAWRTSAAKKRHKNSTGRIKPFGLGWIPKALDDEYYAAKDREQRKQQSAKAHGWYQNRVAEEAAIAADIKAMGEEWNKLDDGEKRTRVEKHRKDHRFGAKRLAQQELLKEIMEKKHE